jgi:glycosidase
MPVIYYGTEVGMTQRYDGVIENAEARLPMLWGDAQNQDVLAHFQELGRMRRESVALRRGDRRTLLADEEVFAYERRSGDEVVTIALNFSPTPQTRDIPGMGLISLSPFGERVRERGE